jgi:hypothetical protein
MRRRRNRKVRQRCEGCQNAYIERLTAALAEATSATFGDMEFVALMLYSAMAGSVRVALEAGASPKMVVRLREELLMLCQAYAARSARLS